MQVLIDFLPILLFFTAYKLYGIIVGTAVLMIATVLQMAYLYKTEGRLQTIHKASLSLVLIFGTLTLLLDDIRFIQWKPTILYLAIALFLSIFYWIGKKNLLHVLLSTQIKLPQYAWDRLHSAWIYYSLFIAGVNAYMVLYHTTESWFHFKLWGFIFPIVFIIGQGIYISRHLQQKPSA
jgi:intracellular septation protein